jgi:signal transduction histidine kinase
MPAHESIRTKLKRSGPGLRQKLLFWFILLSLVPLLGSVGLGYLTSEEIISSLVGRYLLGISELQARALRHSIDEQRVFLEAVAQDRTLSEVLEGAPPVGPDGPGEMRWLSDRLEAEIMRSRTFRALYVTDREGWPRAGAGAWPSNDIRAPRAGLQVVHAGVHEDPPELELFIPLRGTSADLVGYLVGSLRLSGASELLEIPEHIAGTVETFILDDRGWPLAVSHPHGHISYVEPLRTPLRDAPFGTLAQYQDRLSVEVLGATSEIPGLPWRFVTEVPLEDALGSLRDLRQLSVALGGLFGLLVAALAWLVSGGIVAPVRVLVDGARRVGSGELGYTVPVEGSDEIGELSGSFNEMSRTLETNRERIHTLHQKELTRAGQLATVGELASGVAHEIRNPLVGIANGLDLVVDHVAKDEYLNRVVDEMQRQIRRMERAVEDLLAFARPRAPSLAPISPTEIVARAEALIGPAAERDGVMITPRFEEGLPVIEVDGELLGQALVNLLMNAVQASGRGSSVNIDVGLEDDAVAFVVADRGTGIEPETINEIFKPFFTTKHRGTGLGLAITKQIVERLGGSLEVESGVGVGTTFTLTMPIESAPRETGTQAEGDA